MVVLTRKTVHQFVALYPSATEAINEWYIKTKAANWTCFADAKNTFNSVDHVGNDNYVFNIKGNQYRLIVRIIFPVRTVYIRFFGTHAEYDKIDASSA